MLQHLLCRIRLLPSLSAAREKSLSYPGLVIRIQDGGDHPQRNLAMLSLTEALIYVRSHPKATLHISEEVVLPRVEPHEGQRPDQASCSLSLGMTDDGKTTTVQYAHVSPCHRLAQSGVDADFSQVPFADPGGRWPMKTEDVDFTRSVG